MQFLPPAYYPRCNYLDGARLFLNRCRRIRKTLNALRLTFRIDTLEYAHALSKVSITLQQCT